MRKLTEIFVILIIIIIVIVMIQPLRGILHFDEEDFRFTIMPTILFGRAILNGHYPFWTSDYGFGMPTAFFTDLNRHPLFWFISIDPRRALMLIYALHIFLGGYGMWRLCLRFKIKTWIALAGTLTFLLSSPVLNYLYADFWLPHLLGYTALPWIILLTTNLLESRDRNTSLFNALGLGLSLGFTTLISYPTIFFFFGCLFTAVFVLCNPRLALRQWKWLLLSVGVVLLITSGRIYTTFSELSLFDSAQPFPLFQSPFGLDELWSIFLRPIVFNTGDNYQGLFIPLGDYYTNIILWRGVRHISFGPIFAILSLIALFLPRKLIRPNLNLTLPFIIFAGLYLIRPEFIYNFISAPIGFCNCLIPLGILLAGELLTFLTQKGKPGFITTSTLILIQVAFIVLGAYPFYFSLDSYRHEIRTQPVLFNVLRDTDTIQMLQKEIGEEGSRLFLSAEVEELISTRSLMTAGISDNSLPLHGIRVVNGQYKGISMRLFCSDPARLIGLLGPNNCRNANRAFFDLTGIRYILQEKDEGYLDELELVDIVYSAQDGRQFGLYRNPQAWDEAVYMSPQILDLVTSPPTGMAENGLSSHDLQPALAFLEEGHAPIKVTYQFGDIHLQLTPETTEATVMLTEMYRSDWKATAHGTYGKHTIDVKPAMQVFIGLQVPPGTNFISLSYRPTLRIIIEYLSLAGLVLVAGFFFYLCIRVMILPNIKASFRRKP